MSAHDNPEEYVEKYIGYNFKNHSILKEAVRQPENRRLGMLGDKVIGTVILDTWYRTPGLDCERGSHQMQLYGSNREMAKEARRAGFDDFVDLEMHQLDSRYYIHELATEVEAIKTKERNALKLHLHQQSQSDGSRGECRVLEQHGPVLDYPRVKDI
ncbi:hypothetical protein BDW67DRAFT_184402 [Aspergillus spinulosporus]